MIPRLFPGLKFLGMALLVLLIAATFWHAQLGVQVVVEDYVHNEAVKLAALLAEVSPPQFQQQRNPGGKKNNAMPNVESHPGGNGLRPAEDCMEGRS